MFFFSFFFFRLMGFLFFNWDCEGGEMYCKIARVAVYSSRRDKGNIRGESKSKEY